ncbi:receptor-like protein 43 [Magnolia sinica]|uniref:receptor-like protein 43 n=1 Tax=Magnolia sinica TaxID=86752 RepID=UPI00265B658D|nr:receptor-like protein 43 [Magnolia sinica]
MGRRNRPILPFLLLLISLASELLLLPGDSKTHPSDIQALKDLQQGLDSSSITPGSCISSWNFSIDPCDHIFSESFTCGFRCDTSVSGLTRITEISLDHGAAYSGSLSLSNLPYLETLDIADNLFTGPIPSSLSNITRLRRISLSRNAFSGEIPTSIGSISSLEELYLDNNQLQGPIPESIGALQNLKRLELQANKLFGKLPDMSSLKSLYFLDMSDNRISGNLSSMPESIVEISMRNNSLEQLPDGLGNLRFLQVLDLSNNNLSGGVPAVVFNHPSLEQLTLSHNQLSSLQEPENSGAGSQLIAVDLGYNALGGLLPAFMGMMPRLSALTLESNRFTGMIPSQYALKAVVPGPGMAPFMRLLLSGNYLFGPIPSPLIGMKPGSAIVSLVDNCLMRCPESFFFCQGGKQKSFSDCRNFSPVIP